MISTTMTSDKDVTMKDMDMKEKLASNIIPKVGDEVVGFKFDSYDGHDVNWGSYMEDYIGERGVVIGVMEDKGWFLIEFRGACYVYPTKLAHLAYEQKERTIEELLKEIKETKSILGSIAEEQKQKEQVLIALKEELKKRGVVMVEDVPTTAGKPEEDMSDPMNWKVGDILEQHRYDFKPTFTPITKIEGGKWWTRDKDGSESWDRYEEMKAIFKFHARIS